GLWPELHDDDIIDKKIPPYSLRWDSSELPTIFTLNQIIVSGGITVTISEQMIDKKNIVLCCSDYRSCIFIDKINSTNVTINSMSESYISISKIVTEKISMRSSDKSTVS